MKTLCTGGLEKPPGEDSTFFGTIGADWGIPLDAQSDGVALGPQLGTDVKFREDDTEWDVAAGAFGRNLRSFGDQQAAIAMLLDYRHTSFDNDVWALRPIIGTTLDQHNAIGLTGEIGLNSDACTRGNLRIREEAIDRIEAFRNAAIWIIKSTHY